MLQNLGELCCLIHITVVCHGCKANELRLTINADELDLSRNSIEGEIPTEIFELLSLRKSPWEASYMLRKEPRSVCLTSVFPLHRATQIVGQFADRNLVSTPYETLRP
jgi:hypothetical protein